MSPAGLVDDPQRMLAMFTNYAVRLTVTPSEALLAYVPMAFNETLGGPLGIKLGQRVRRVACCDRVGRTPRRVNFTPCKQQRSQLGTLNRSTIF